MSLLVTHLKDTERTQYEKTIVKNSEFSQIEKKSVLTDQDKHI